MFTVKVDATSVMAKLDQIGPHLHDTLLPEIITDADTIMDRARALASGAVLKEKTGSYVKSIKDKVYDNRTKIYAKVFSRDPRAGLFEWGGTTPAREILPDVKKALAFMMSAGEVFAAVVHRPVVRYSPKPVITAAFQEQKGHVEADIQRAGIASIVDGW